MSTAIYKTLNHESRMKDLVLFASGIELYLAERRLTMANAGVPERNVAESFAISQTCSDSSVFSTGDDVFAEGELCSPSEIAEARWGVEINFVIPAFLSTKYVRRRKLQIYRRLSNDTHEINGKFIPRSLAAEHLTSQYVTIINDSRYKAEERRSCDSATNTA